MNSEPEVFCAEHIHIHTHTYIYTYTYIHTHIHKHTYTHIHIHTQVYMGCITAEVNNMRRNGVHETAGTGVGIQGLPYGGMMVMI